MSSANRFEAFAAQHAFLETRPRATSVGRWLTQVWHGPYYPQFAGDEGAGVDPIVRQMRTISLST